MTTSTASCQVPGCAWEEKWSIRHAAGCAATWHVYENHRDQWVALFGATEPRDPRPETVGERRG